MRAPLRQLASPANLLALGILAASFGALAWLRARTPFDPFSADGMQRLLDDLGWLAPVIFVLVVGMAVVVSQVPGVPLAIAAGAVWGPVLGGAYTVLGTFMGGMLAYLLGRTLGRGVMRVLAGRVIVFRSQRGRGTLGLLIFASRAVPLMPFDLISYAAGVSALPAGVYAVATLLGLIPSTLLLTTLGGTLRLGFAWGLALSAAATFTVLLLAWLLRNSDPWGLRAAIVHTGEGAQAAALPDDDPTGAAQGR